MPLLSLEHSKTAYRIDFALYGAVLLALVAALALRGPVGHWPALAAAVVVGLAGWTLAEYAVHRFVLHGLQPFAGWHAQHHRRPQALIYTPTLISAAAIGLLVSLPAWLMAGPWVACALTLGVVAGSLGYALMHHTLHHHLAGCAWLHQRQIWHATHHRAGLGPRPGRYGVTSGFWDRVFGTDGPVAKA